MDEDRNRAYLEAEIAGLKRQFLLSSDGFCRIGRNYDNTIVLDDDSISRNHVLLQRLHAGTFLIFDLGSRNGTLVNGKRLLAPAVLRDGDVITIGKIEITFYHQGQDADRDSDRATSKSTNVNFDRKLITVMVVDVRDSTALAKQLDTDKFLQITRALFRELQLVDIVCGLQSRFGLDAPIHIAGSLNSGWASIGNVGGAAASDYTAMGEVVNKAFRLESATKEAGCDLLVSPETLNFLLKSSPLGNLFREHSVKLKGYDQPVAAWGANFADLQRTALNSHF